MHNKIIFLTLAWFALSCQQQTKKPKWEIKATYYESCSCSAPCPCPFGLPMTNSYCKLNSLLEVHEGQFENIDLKGTKVILSGKVGDWGEYYFSDATTQKQKNALEAILKVINIASFDTILSSKQSDVNFENKDGKVSFSTSNINVVMNMVKGKNNQPVVVQNLDSKLYEHYIPHLSAKNCRTFSDTTHDFAFEEKAGFSSEWNLTENDFK